MEAQSQCVGKNTAAHAAASQCPFSPSSSYAASTSSTCAGARGPAEDSPITHHDVARDEVPTERRAVPSPGHRWWQHPSEWPLQARFAHGKFGAAGRANLRLKGTFLHFDMSADTDSSVERTRAVSAPGSFCSPCTDLSPTRRMRHHDEELTHFHRSSQASSSGMTPQSPLAQSPPSRLSSPAAAFWAESRNRRLALSTLLDDRGYEAGGEIMEMERPPQEPAQSSSGVWILQPLVVYPSGSSSQPAPAFAAASALLPSPSQHSQQQQQAPPPQQPHAVPEGAVAVRAEGRPGEEVPCRSDLAFLRSCCEAAASSLRLPSSMLPFQVPGVPAWPQGGIAEAPRLEVQEEPNGSSVPEKARLLFRAVMKAERDDFLRLVADPDVDIRTTDLRGNAVMHFWARSKVSRQNLMMFIGETLVKHGADVCAQRISDGMSPLHHAVIAHNSRRGWLDFHKARFLMQRGASPRAVTHLNQEPKDLLKHDSRDATAKLLQLLTYGLVADDRR
eukprot:TRINITY_DN20436_c0_g1_i1.p1 TRINITY_DN20436_c0_g1~~TRINITY_DN20436_c0_g1_i1.p1  ORF type:complete len:532 (+),score=104.73 TRINITY_DN20436_c0_g1_i1:85-1596(+)